MKKMKAKRKVSPSEFILSVLSPEERLDVTLKIAKEAFKDTKLDLKKIEEAVQRIRRNIYEKREKEERTPSKGRG